MPRCGCQDSCSCLIVAGSGAIVEGIGTLERPYEISTESGELEGRLVFDDSGSVDFTALGAGSRTAPLVVSGDVALTKLTDVTTDPPIDGAGPVWRTDHWEWETPAAAAVPVSGVWGTAPLDAKYGADSLIGRETYIDSAGKLRSRPDVIPTSAGFFTGTTPITDYPPGVSVMSVSSAEGAANWPAGQSCTVVTHKRVDTATAGQWCYLNSSSVSKAWYRNANNALWGPWVSVANSATPRIARYKSVAQTLTTANTYYTLTYESEDEPGVGIAYAGGVFTFSEAGVYQVNMVQHFSAMTGNPQLRFTFLVNGASNGYQVSGGISAVLSESLSMSKAWRFAAGDTLAMQAYCSNAGQAAYGSSARYSFIDITKIAP